MTDEREAGFELKVPGDEEKTFFPWSLGYSGKDLRIIDAVTRMPLGEFMEAMQDPSQFGRGVVQLAMIGLSIRAKNPEWTVERILRIVDNLDFVSDDYVPISGDVEQAPLAEESSPDNGKSSASSSDESSLHAIPLEPMGSKTSKPTPA